MNDVSGVIQAVRGPIMLITLGGLVEMDYAGVFAFWRTWPILIIVFGLLKLMERATARPGQYPPYSGPPAGGGQPGNTPTGGNVV